MAYRNAFQGLILATGFFTGAAGATGVGGEQAAQQGIEGHERYSIKGTMGRS